MAVEQQLTLEVGGDVGVGITSTFRIHGETAVLGQLDKDTPVHVVCTDIDGEVVFSSYGSVSGVGFRTHKKKGVRWTERAHTIKLGDEED